jgi:hypothetical protein
MLGITTGGCASMIYIMPTVISNLLSTVLFAIALCIDKIRKE